MPIVFAPTDKTLKIVKVLADEKTKKHLASLGVVQNGEIEVVSSSNGKCHCGGQRSKACDQPRRCHENSSCIERKESCSKD